MTFWYKISAFHELRVVAYLEYKLMLMKEYDPTAFGENEGNDIGDKEPDVKPVVNRETKPKIDPTRFLNAGTLTRAASRNEDSSFLRRAIASIRAPNLSVEQQRISLQKRLSNVNKRISSRLPRPNPAALAAAGLDLDGPVRSPSIPVPPVPPVPPVLPPGLRSATLAPLVPPRPPVLPPSMRINFPGGPGRSSMRLPGFSGLPGNSQPRVANASGLGAPPPIPPRTGASLTGFGITPGALQIMQGQRPQHPAGFRARKDEPRMDEI